MTFDQLIRMRQSREREYWDRLAFDLAHQAGFQGAKNVRIEDFHKFYQTQRGLTKAKLHAMKGMFKKAED